MRVGWRRRGNPAARSRYAPAAQNRCSAAGTTEWSDRIVIALASVQCTTSLVSVSGCRSCLPSAVWAVLLARRQRDATSRARPRRLSAPVAVYSFPCRLSLACNRMCRLHRHVHTAREIDLHVEHVHIPRVVAIRAEECVLSHHGDLQEFGERAAPWRYKIEVSGLVALHMNAKWLSVNEREYERLSKPDIAGQFRLAQESGYTSSRQSVGGLLRLGNSRGRWLFTGRRKCRSKQTR